MAVLLDLPTPLREVEAFNGFGPPSGLEARGDLKGAGLGGVETAALVLPVRESRSTPITALELTSGGLRMSGRAHGLSRGGARPLCRGRNRGGSRTTS